MYLVIHLFLHQLVLVLFIILYYSLVDKLPHIPMSILKQSHNVSKPGTVKIWSHFPSSYKKAVVQVLSFNFAFDGVEIKSKSSNILSLTLNNSLCRFRNEKFSVFRCAEIPKSTGKYQDPLFRQLLGFYSEYIDKNGKDGVYLERDGILYHIYYATHAYTADLKAAMQFYDRPGCMNSIQPCITHFCTRGSFDLVSHTYINPNNNACKYHSGLKTIGRSILHFPPTSVYRLLPFVAVYANNVFVSVDNKKEKVVDTVEDYMGTTLSDEDKEIVIVLFIFLRCSDHHTVLYSF